MKRSFMKWFTANIPLLIAFAAFVIFSGNKNPEDKTDTAGKCCSGYTIPTNRLQRFMLDSLHGIQFEGGVYSKQSLLTAINQIAGDSVYLLNILKNCNIAQGTDLALTSPQTTGISFVRPQPNCYPCPGKACCPQKVCVARIDRSCINYKVLSSFAAGNGTDITSFEK